MELRYLYVGTSDIESDLAAWLAAPGTSLRWRFRHFGADVAAIDPGNPGNPGQRPLLLLADHRPAGSVLPIFATDRLDVAVATLAEGGWEFEAGPLGTPEGPASLLRSRGGGEIAVLQVDRPEAMEGAYADQDNAHRVIG